VSSTEPRERTEQAQREAIRRRRGEGPLVPRLAVAEAASPYGGIVTRTVALAIDAAIIDGVALFLAVVCGLALSLLHLPSQVDTAIAIFGGFVWILWSIGYFVFFWSTTGQTPGNRVMSIVVVDVAGRGPLKPRRALLRFLALTIGAAALMSGILIMLWDKRRRCFHDRVARTLVYYAPDNPFPQQPRNPPAILPPPRSVT
jgi:uncharacterized RDD family membrane protein YckC